MRCMVKLFITKKYENIWSGSVGKIWTLYALPAMDAG